MRIEVTNQASFKTVAIKDEVIDFSNISDFRDVLEENAKGADRDVILCLAGVSYIGSVGLGMISLIAVMLDKESRRFVVVCDTEEVKRLFHISGLYRVLKIVDNLASAEKLLAEAK